MSLISKNATPQKQLPVRVRDIVQLLKARIVAGSEMQDREVRYGFASDLMSDVLTLDTDHLLLITGLANLQVIRTAEMADIMCVAFVRDKKVSPEMIELATENHIVLLETPYSMFRAVSVLHDNGLEPVY